MARFKLLNGVRVQLTAEEETQRDIDEAKVLADKQAAIDARAATSLKEASGKQKLKDLGLDDEEIKALTGK
tara:strand:+ start:820 stop:1032 length:213 start_codon:yes stop_codon:yes gene_type:complete